jgi:hypothetical protein
MIESKIEKQETQRRKCPPMNRKNMWKYMLAGILLLSAIIIGIAVGVSKSSYADSLEISSSTSNNLNPENIVKPTISPPILHAPTLSPSLASNSNSPTLSTNSPSLASNPPSMATKFPSLASKSLSPSSRSKNNPSPSSKNQEPLCFLVDSLWHIQTHSGKCAKRSDTLESRFVASDGSVFFKHSSRNRKSFYVFVFSSKDCSGDYEHKVYCDWNDQFDDDDDLEYQALNTDQDDGF